jgi:hypothetical protein
MLMSIMANDPSPKRIISSLPETSDDIGILGTDYYNRVLD